MVSTDTQLIPDYQSRLSFEGKNFVVVGAGQGMGRQSSHALRQCGAQVVCADVEAERAKEIAEECGGFAWSGDATSRAGVERLVSDAQTLVGGRIHGFIDIIGMARFEDLLDLSDETFEWEIDICIRHAYLLSQLFGRHFRDAGGGGSMVFIASVSGLTSAPRHAAYGAMKAGLMSWMRTTAMELAPYGVRANAVAPGSILTPRMEIAFDEERRKLNDANTPLARMGMPSDIASAALFLSSDLAQWITGQTVVVDGGVSVKFPYSTL
jgi:NAD(P)-dependent dehydrogenase (short-subunit alcohol dehydrogenase family)